MSSVKLTTDYKKVGAVLAASIGPGRADKFLYEGFTFEDSANFYSGRVKQFLDAGADVLQNHDYNSVATWLPPGALYPPAKTEKPNKRVEDFGKKAVVVLTKRGLIKDPHWALTQLGKDPKVNKGSVSPMIKPYLAKAKEDGVPAALFAVADHAKDVYEHFGFRVLDVIKLGVGEVDIDGKPDENGEGIPIYYMAYNYVEKDS